MLHRIKWKWRIRVKYATTLMHVVFMLHNCCFSNMLLLLQLHLLLHLCSCSLLIFDFISMKSGTCRICQYIILKLWTDNVYKNMILFETIDLWMNMFSKHSMTVQHILYHSFENLNKKNEIGIVLLFKINVLRKN